MPPIPDPPDESAFKNEMNALKKIVGKMALAAATAAAVAVPLIVSADVTGGGSGSDSTSASSTCYFKCYWPDGRLAYESTCTSGVNACCVKCDGKKGQAGYNEIGVGGGTKYCKVIAYDASKYPIKTKTWWGGTKVHHSPCD